MKFKLISTISAFALMSIGTVSIIPTLLSSNNNIVNQTNPNNKMIITNNIKHSSNIQVVNSINEVIIEKTDTVSGSSYAIIDNNGYQEIYVWGQNTYGQLGLEDNYDRMTPTMISPEKLGDYFFIKEFYMLSGSTVAKVSTPLGEQIYVWGKNDEGQLGIGNSQNQTKPFLFDMSVFGEYKSIKEFKISNQNNVFSSNITSHAILETEDGKENIFVWGANNYRNLGVGLADMYPSPTKFDLSRFGSDFGSIIKMEFSAVNSYAIIETTAKKQKIFFWGGNSSKQIRNSTDLLIPYPYEIIYPFLDNAKIKRIGTGIQAIFIIVTRNGVDEIYVSGNNQSGLLGLGNYDNQSSMVLLPPSNLGGATEIIDFSINANCYAKVKINEKIKFYVWGDNNSGQLGIGKDPSNEYVNKPTEFLLDYIGSPLEIYSWSFDSWNLAIHDMRYAYVKTSTGDGLYLWGNNTKGKLGVNLIGHQKSPVLNNNLDLNNNKFKSVKLTKSNYSFVTLESNSDGKNSYYAAGENQNGAFGNGIQGETIKFIEVLKNRYTKPNVVEFNTNLTANEVLDKINPNGSLDLIELNKYIDTSSFPIDATLSINNEATTVDHENGIINLAINTNKYYDFFVTNPIFKNKNFNTVLKGFKMASDIETTPVTINNFPKTEDLTIDEWYNKLADINSKVINRQLLSEYLNLAAIPETANMYLHRTTFDNKKQAQFTFKSDQVYSNNGRTVNRLYEVPNLSVALSSATEKPVDVGLIVGLTIGSLALIAIIILTVILYKKYKLQKSL